MVVTVEKGITREGHFLLSAAAELTDHHEVEKRKKKTLVR